MTGTRRRALLPRHTDGETGPSFRLSLPHAGNAEYSHSGVSLGSVATSAEKKGPIGKEAQGPLECEGLPSLFITRWELSNAKPAALKSDGKPPHSKGYAARRRPTASRPAGVNSQSTPAPVPSPEKWISLARRLRLRRRIVS